MIWIIPQLNLKENKDHVYNQSSDLVDNSISIQDKRDSENPKGLSNTVITVTTVTEYKNQEDNNTGYNKRSNNSSNMFKLWSNGDIYGCKRCNQTGDRWYMLDHDCKNNRKNPAEA